MTLKVLKQRTWARVQWQLVRDGPGAGKYTYTVRVRTIQKSGKFNKFRVKKTTKSLKEARQYYKSNSYSKRKPSEL